jgi:hypothetical protein
MSIHARHAPCLIFADKQIPYVIWFEDALHYYGVPTVVFDLYLLVLDIDAAADCLIKAGWTINTQSSHRIGNAETKIPQVPLISPDSQTKTVLLLASDWKFPLPASPSLTDDQGLSFPPLPGLLDALIESWLDGPSEDEALLLHLACQFNYLYEYVPALKRRSFANQMRYEHRQFHFDVRAGMSSSTLPFRRHERGIRNELLQGRYELQECSASLDNEDLFDSWAKIRLPDPPGDQSVE